MQRKKKKRDAFTASRGLLKGKYSTKELLKFRRRERAREIKDLKMTPAQQPLAVKICEQTCKWCPSQWEGSIVDGRPIYARYRHGYLSIRVGRVGQTIDDAIRSDREIVGLAIGDDLDGFMTYTDLRRHTRGVITWPRKKPLERSLLD